MTWRSTGVAIAVLPAGSTREVFLDGASVLLVNLGPRVHALEAVCPHQGGRLSEAPLEGGQVICPEHNAQFDVATGAVLVDPYGLAPQRGRVEPLRTYPARVEKGMVEVDLPG